MPGYASQMDWGSLQQYKPFLNTQRFSRSYLRGVVKVKVGVHDRKPQCDCEG